MWIGILSDTHDQFDRTSRAVQTLMQHGAEHLIHCGDLVQPEIIVTCSPLPLSFVFGNNDVRHMSQLRSAAQVHGAVCLEWGGEIELAGKRVAVTHGHDLHEARRLLSSKPDYLFTGHSHVAADWQDGATRRINPGALHRAKVFSVALLSLQTGELRYLEIPR